MGGLFGVASKQDCVNDLFFGTDYHSHLGTRRGGMAVCQNGLFEKSIHNIENSPFRTKFSDDVQTMRGTIGIGAISDGDPQPLIIKSHFGSFVLATVGRINNEEELIKYALHDRKGHFNEMSAGRVNATELVASVITANETLVDGIRIAQKLVEGSLTMLVMTENGIYAARDRLGRTSLTIGQGENGYAVSMESFAYQNLGYDDKYELGPNEIVLLCPEGFETISPPSKEKKICAFLYTYYGYPTASYEGKNVEEVRYQCGCLLAKRDKGLEIDYVSGVPDSGIAHALGYSHEAKIPYKRPLVKYTPTWPRSFMPPKQDMRQVIANMKLISIRSLIKDKKMLLIDDSIVRGTQTKKMADFLFKDGAKEVHVRSACPPIMYGCKYLNFSRSTSEYDLISRQVIKELEGDRDEEKLPIYADSSTPEHQNMVDAICKMSNFTSLKFHTLEDVIKSIGLDKDEICTYCWNGKE